MGLIQLNIFEFGGDLTWKGNILDLIRLENLLMVLYKNIYDEEDKRGLMCIFMVWGLWHLFSL